MHALALLSVAVSTYYLTWRGLSTLDTDVPALAGVLYVAEIYIFLRLVGFLVVTWETDRHAPFALRDDASVDVFITTYDEPADIVRATALGALAMEHPHRTVILDDGRRKEIRAIAAELGCDYLTRADNTGHKAGNLNNALQHSSADFIAVFDADHVPQQAFLRRTLGYFVDPAMALVQTPQEFYNRDSRQHPDAASAWHEQTLFYRVIQAGKNQSNSAFWCGSCGVLRRAALDSIGGVASEYLTEDLHTTLRLHRAGWKTFYHREPLAYGIAPDDFAAFRTQRLRWGRGTMQILRTRENPAVARGLTVWQRISYLSSMLTYFDAHIRLVLLTFPALVLLSGLSPMATSAPEFFLRFAPHLVLSVVAATLAQRGANRIVWSERFAVARMFIFLRASVTLVTGGRRLAFTVTPKVASVSAGGQGLGHRVLLLAAALALISGVLAIAGFGPAAGLASWMIVANMVWACVGSTALLLALSVLRPARWQRHAYRFPWGLPLAYRITRTGDAYSTVTTDVSWRGISFVPKTPLSEDDDLELRLRLQGGEVLEFQGAVVRDGAAGGTAGVRFTEATQSTRDKLTLALVTAGAADQDRESTAAWRQIERTRAA